MLYPSTRKVPTSRSRSFNEIKETLIMLPIATYINPARGDIPQTFVEPATTRLPEYYEINTPLSGQIKRISIKPGDSVVKNQMLAMMDLYPLTQSVKQAQAEVDSIKAQIRVKENNQIEKTMLVEYQSINEASNKTLQASDEEISALKAVYERAKLAYKRHKQLKESEALAQAKLDDAEFDHHWHTDTT